MKRNWSMVIFWGSLWGLVEATVGHFLHLLPIGIGWVFYFPLALYFMDRAYRDTKKASSIFFVAFVSAVIKLTDLMLPIRVDYVINPAMSILLEGVVVYAGYTVYEKNNETLRFPFLRMLALSGGWRVLYLFYLLFTPEWMVEISPLRAASPLIQFLFLESLVNSGLICAFVRLRSAAAAKDLSFSNSTVIKSLQPGNLVHSLGALVLALIIKGVL